MKATDKKPGARPRIIRHGLPRIARSQEANIQRQQIGQILRNNSVQAKLTIGAPNDKYEQEADHVADKVMSMPEQTVQRQADENDEEKEAEPEREEEAVQTKPLAENITPLIQRQAAPPEEEEEAEPEREEEEGAVQSKSLTEGITPLVQRQAEPAEEVEEPLQTKPLANNPAPVTAGLQSRIQSLRGGGQPLPATERAFFEPRFGTDFSHVRIHNYPTAANVARSINAHAFTRGHDVVFGNSEYTPGTSSGRRLLAHELTHVVQQKGWGYVKRKRALTPLSLSHLSIQTAFKKSGQEGNCIQRQASTDEKNKKLVYDYATYDSLYDKAAHGWNFIKDKQILAIDSIYTEAKKPKKPSLFEQFISALVIAGLVGTLNVLGTALSSFISSRTNKVFLRNFKKKWGEPVADNSGKLWYYSKMTMIDEVYAEQIKKRTMTLAKTIGEFSKAAFIEGIKTHAIPNIKELIHQGKPPIDAFFEGQKETAIDAAKEAFDSEMGRKPKIFKEEADPISVAEAGIEARDVVFANAYDLQKVNTLQAWLIFQARSVLGETKDNITDLSSLQTNQRSKYIQGVIHIYGEITPKGNLKFPRKILRGMTEYMQAQFKNKKILNLGLPVYVEIYSRYLTLIGMDAGKQNWFFMTIDESGNNWQSPITTSVKRGLAKLGSVGSNRGYGSFPGGVPPSDSKNINKLAKNGVKVIQDLVSLINSNQLKG